MSSVIGFDFDETLADKMPTGWGGSVLVPIPVIMERLQEYHALGCKCIILTARTPSDENKRDIAEFLQQYRVDHCISDIHYTSHKPKGSIALRLGIHLHYDDDEEHLQSCREHGIHVVDTK